MKKIKIMVIICILLFNPSKIEAKRGCCSHHGGVAGCDETGKQICMDGSLSPSCTCEPTITYIYGCTDISAKNYDPRANKDDGSCEYYIYGCMDETAKNYDPRANKDDGTCEYYVFGCTNALADNYNSEADKDDGSCILSINADLEKTDNNSNQEKVDDSGLLDALLGIGTISSGVYLYKKRKQKEFKKNKTTNV